ncbi:LysR substrate-binding domain-containing protein [Amycolatopsis alkalitolerans]|uniref:LysR substrate-binding domain-containing protein n=1 Tax=Amycolatopsis alkalitolerans TaxID=2547244 RepID=UPI001F3069A5|nr:LysR substrate-binding domain-containing protein [Amycolatopsis alkalitolerans]
MTAVVLNVTGLDSTAATYLTVAPASYPPSVSTVNFAAGEIRANSAVVPLEGGVTRVRGLHMSTAEQFAALSNGELDVGLVREHPIGHDLDAVLVAEEPLGVLLATELAAKLGGPDGLRLAELAGLDWVGFPRSGSPVWYDEIVAIFRSHGLDIGPAAPAGQSLIADVKLATVTAGGAFALAPPGWSQPMPDSATWSPLAGNPLSGAPGPSGPRPRTGATSAI